VTNFGIETPRPAVLSLETMKTFLALMLALISGFAFSAEEKKDDPIVGIWRGFGIQGRILDFYPDGKVVELVNGEKGKTVASWVKKDSTSVETKYTITFGSGNFIYEMQMNKPADKLTGKSSSGKKIEGELVKR